MAKAASKQSSNSGSNRKNSSSSSKKNYDAIRKKRVKNKSPPKKDVISNTSSMSGPLVLPQRNKATFYTVVSGNDFAFVNHPTKPNFPAYTFPIDKDLQDEKSRREYMHVSDIKKRVDPSDAEQIWKLPYKSPNQKELKWSSFTIYLKAYIAGETPSNATRKAWVENDLLPVFNTYGSSPVKYYMGKLSFEYGGDITPENTNTFAADYLTISDTFELMERECGKSEDNSGK